MIQNNKAEIFNNYVSSIVSPINSMIKMLWDEASVEYVEKLTPSDGNLCFIEYPFTAPIYKKKSLKGVDRIMLVTRVYDVDYQPRYIFNVAEMEDLSDWDVSSAIKNYGMPVVTLKSKSNLVYDRYYIDPVSGNWYKHYNPFNYPDEYNLQFLKPAELSNFCSRIITSEELDKKLVPKKRQGAGVKDFSIFSLVK